MKMKENPQKASYPSERKKKINKNGRHKVLSQ
jgi:hypothetical protein